MKHTVALLLALVPLAHAADRDDAWVSRRVRDIRDSDTDGWRRIPWCATLAEAARVAAKEGRPMFLFTHEGNIDSGRC